MNLEAIIVFGSLCTILGIVLLIPGLWWARRKAKKDPAFGKTISFTRYGWIFLFVMLVILLGGLCMEFIAPESFIGKMTSSRTGRLIWTAGIIFSFSAIQKFLNQFGISIERNKTNTNLSKKQSAQPDT